MAKTIKTVIKLRRDSLSNYASVGTHVPLVGEVCLVDTLSRGLRMKIGDGVNTFLNLPWVDEDNPSIILGYLNNGHFYKDLQHTQEISDFFTNIIYIDIPSSVIYYYDGESLQASKVNLPNASASVPGVLKLYTTHGQNEDGTMTQKAITNAIDDIYLTVDSDEEGNYLDLNKPW